MNGWEKPEEQVDWAEVVEFDDSIREVECPHDNVETTFEDATLWQGRCEDCGAELEDQEKD